MALTLENYTPDKETEWDEFVLHRSMNGTFLQTRRFINYHKAGKFQDCSLCVRKGNELVAVILACELMEDGLKTFFSHKGTTYGGICLSEKIYSASEVDWLFQLLEEYWQTNGYKKIYLKMVPNIYQRSNTDLIDYYLYKSGFVNFSELNYYLPLDRYREDIVSQFTASKRRDYRYSLKSNMQFRKLETREEIADYYQVLLMNLEKLGVPAIHTLEDLYELQFERFRDAIEFYGVYLDNKMIAGSMLFYFDKGIVHTQYLSSNDQYLKLFPMDFLIYNLIQMAVDRGMSIFTFGICTENQGKYLNLGLSRFKEGFGSEFCINHSYEKKYN